ncbi:MAG: hypothetical protein IPG50_12490 [Myxococcales bacterium]|nr:hypothetical protein [Myxococcales bacterium]
MRALHLSLLLLIAAGCGASPGPVPASGKPGDASARGADAWGTFHSTRFGLTLRLPGGREWRIDDRSKAELVALHPTTNAKLVALRWYEADVQTRAGCEAKARDRRLVPPASAVAVDETAGIRPGGDDVRTWVALEPGATPEAPIRGHVTLVAARLKRCVAVHYETTVPSAKHDQELSLRLATLREGTLERLTIDDALEGPVTRERAR